MSNSKATPDFTPEGAIVNFMYFMYNHSGFFKVIEEVLSEKGHLVEHCKDKLKGYMGEDQICRPEHIVKFITGLDLDLQLLFTDWICKNYNAGFDVLVKNEQQSW